MSMKILQVKRQSPEKSIRPGVPVLCLQAGQDPTILRPGVLLQYQHFLFGLCYIGSDIYR
jgi:hypothetical protein